MNDEPIYIPESIQAGTIAEISQKGEVYVIINKEDMKYFAEQIVNAEDRLLSFDDVLYRMVHCKEVVRQMVLNHTIPMSMLRGRWIIPRRKFRRVEDAGFPEFMGDGRKTPTGMYRELFRAVKRFLKDETDENRETLRDLVIR